MRSSAACGTLNATLADIGALDRQIVTAQAAGQSTADLENQRDAALTTLSELVSRQRHGPAERQRAAGRLAG